jgi:hypothetical protein
LKLIALKKVLWGLDGILRNVIVISKVKLYEFMEQEKFELSSEGSSQIEGLSPEQNKIFDKVDASFFLTGASNDQGLAVETSLDGKQIKMILHKQTIITGRADNKPERAYYSGILWQDDIATKLRGDIAQKFFDFYGPIAELKHPSVDAAINKEMLVERSLEDKLLGLE